MNALGARVGAGAGGSSSRLAPLRVSTSQGSSHGRGSHARSARPFSHRNDMTRAPQSRRAYGVVDEPKDVQDSPL